jgi:hypothetical protein
MSRNVEYDAKIKRLAEMLCHPGVLCGFGAIRDEEIQKEAVGLTERIQRTYETKDVDYSENDLPMGNFRESLELGILPWVGIMLRIGDKKRRVGSFIKRASYLVKDENVDDTLVDLANYAVLGLVMFEEDEPNFLNNDHIGPYTSWYFDQNPDAKEEFLTDIEDARKAFLSMAVNAIHCRLLFQLRHHENVDSWYGKSWEELCLNYGDIAHVAKRFYAVGS